MLAGSDQLSFSLTLTSANPLTFPAGGSPFDLADLNASGISVLVSDSSHSLGFEISSVSDAPEPSSEVLFASGLSVLLVLWRRRGSNA
jgi:hypothetical protein